MQPDQTSSKKHLIKDLLCLNKGVSKFSNMFLKQHSSCTSENSYFIRRRRERITSRSSFSKDIFTAIYPVHPALSYYVITIHCARHLWLFGLSLGLGVLCRISSLKYQGNMFFPQKQMAINSQCKDLLGAYKCFGSSLRSTQAAVQDVN